MLLRCVCTRVFMWVSPGPKWCSYVSVCSAVWAHSSMLVFTCKRGGWSGRDRVSLACPCGMRLHILQHIAEGWGNLLLSKIIGLLHPAISLIIMKASLQFSNYYSMPILFLSNKEEQRCKTKCQDSISCLCLRAIRRWGTYTPSKYHPHLETSDSRTNTATKMTCGSMQIDAIYSQIQTWSDIFKIRHKIIEVHNTFCHCLKKCGKCNMWDQKDGTV